MKAAAIIPMGLAAAITSAAFVGCDDEVARVSDAEALESLGYLSWVDAEAAELKNTGVTVHDSQRSHPGLNLYNSRPRNTIQLVDMRGEPFHAWEFPTGREEGVHHAEITERGYLYAIHKDESLAKLDWDSSLVWSRELRAHHDLDLDEQQNVYVLTRGVRRVDHPEGARLVLDDFVTILSPEGETREVLSIYDVVGHRVPAARMAAIADGEGLDVGDRILLGIAGFFESPPDALVSDLVKSHTAFDVLHTNSVEVVGRSVEGLFEKGDLLICMRHLDLVAVVDIDTKEIAWSWGEGELDMPHHPSLLENGNILIFDNGHDRGYSRVIELNPRTREIEWEYAGTAEREFFSSSRGSAQRLDNGNTLIVESNRGRAFEVTPAGDTVWEFWNPDVDLDAGKRAPIYRMMRIPGDFEPERG